MVNTKRREIQCAPGNRTPVTVSSMRANDTPSFRKIRLISRSHVCGTSGSLFFNPTYAPRTRRRRRPGIPHDRTRQTVVENPFSHDPTAVPGVYVHLQRAALHAAVVVNAPRTRLCIMYNYTSIYTYTRIWRDNESEMYKYLNIHYSPNGGPSGERNYYTEKKKSLISPPHS